VWQWSSFRILRSMLLVMVNTKATVFGALSAHTELQSAHHKGTALLRAL
jgi:hypothetical protein